MDNTMTPRMQKRLFMTVIGVVICSLSVGLFKLAAFGVDPFQAFAAGADALIPIAFGTLYTILNLCLLAFDFFADRHYIGIATFINMFLTGYIVQFSYDVLQGLFPNPSLGLRIASLIIAIVLMCFASAMYFTSDLGVSTYDAIALIIAHTWKIGQFKYVRILCDLVCVILGIVLFLLAGGAFKDIPLVIAGVGTIITAFFMGPLIDFFNRKVAIPFLEKTPETKK